MHEPETLTIRPPTEAGSLLLRVTRGCNWNRCRFCGIYSHFGQPNFEVRPCDEVLADMDAARALYGDHHTAAFLGDADPLIAPPEDVLAILRRLRATFPRVRRVTCYARASTCWQRREHLVAFREAGLDRVHVGLETGSDALLKFHAKGSSQRLLVESGAATRQAGLELSYYVLLGLGGADRSEEHARETLTVLNAVQPEFVRFRRLWIYGGEAGGAPCPLWGDVQAGRFMPQTPEGTVQEMRAMIAGSGYPTEVEAIHPNVYVRVGGRLPESRERMLAKLDGFLARPEAEKALIYGRESAI
jgi:hypothetical protein